MHDLVTSSERAEDLPTAGDQASDPVGTTGSHFEVPCIGRASTDEAEKWASAQQAALSPRSSRRAFLGKLGVGGAMASAALVGGALGSPSAYAAGLRPGGTPPTPPAPPGPTPPTPGPPGSAGTVPLPLAASVVVPSAYTSAAVQAAIDAAATSGRGAVYLPSGTYSFTEVVTVTSKVTIISAADATIEIADGVDGFLFRGYNGDGQQVVLPTLSGGNRQVRLSGVAVMNLFVGLCTGGTVGISLETVPASVSPIDTLDNNVFFQFISNMDYGVQFVSTAPLPRFMQGNVVTGNFITDCLHAVDFNASSVDDNITINIVEIAAIDGASRAGATGISMSGVTSFGSGGHTFKIPSFFGGFDETVPYSYIQFPSFVNQFYIRVAAALLDYLPLVTLSANGALPYLGSNKLVFSTTFGYPTLNAEPIAAVPTPTPGDFNGGQSISVNTLRLACEVGALAAGEAQDFYFYTALLDGYTNNIQVTAEDDGGVPFTISVQDESLFPGSDGKTGPGQVHIRLRTPVATEGATVVLNVVINGGS